ncbi:WDR90 [Bugula neritina]|uniref:WDR90 n=1 Tax=Bugula neritina TaxID=10212 RepID=A0A7J7JTZ5_BUGNE|nr:WDR90 [Bugula neritina]
MLSIYLNRAYSHVKTLRMCANTLIKGLYTSDNYYEPGISLDEAKRLGLPERGIQALPRELSFPLQKSEKWHEKYDLIRFPSESNKTPQEVLSKFDNMSLKPAQSKASASHSKSRPSKQRSGNSGLVGSPVKSTGRISSKSSKIIHKKSVSAPQLPEVGLDEHAHLFLDGVGLRENIPEAGYEPREVHVVADSKKSNSRPTSVMGTESKLKSRKTASSDYQKVSSQRVRFPLAPDLEDGDRSNYKGLQPDPIIKLKKVIGFGGAVMNQAVPRGNREAAVLYRTY